MSERSFQEAFGDWWALLQDRFGQEKSKTVAAFYYRTLEGQLSVSELDEAMAKVAYANTYFPTPKEIVEAVDVGLDLEAEATEQWDRCQSVMQGRISALEDMTPAGQKTVRLLGGPDRLRQTKLDEVKWVRKEFLRLYEHATEIHERETEALPEWTDEGRETYRKIMSGDP